MRKYTLLVCLLLPILVHAQKQGQARYDSLVKELNAPKYQNKQDTPIVQLLNDLTQVMSFINPDEGIKYGFKALEYAQAQGWKYGIAGAYNGLYNCFTAKANFAKAREYCTKALKIYEELGNKANQVACYVNLGSGYMEQGDFSRALAYQLKALKIAEEIGHKRMTAYSLVGVGNTYKCLEDFEKSIAYCVKSLKLMEEMNEQYGIGINLQIIGFAHYSTKQYDSALYFNHKALSTYEKIGDKSTVLILLSATADIYMALGRYSTALEYNFRSLSMANEIGNKVGTSSAHLGIGRTYLAILADTSGNTIPEGNIPKGKAAILTKAIEHLELTVAGAKEVGDPNMLVEAYRNLWVAYKLSGKTNKALEAHEAYAATKDSVFSNDNKIKVAALETQREAELKEKQIEVNRILSLQKRNEQIFFIISIGLLSILVLMVWRNYNRQKANNTQLQEEKKRSDELALHLQELIIHKEELAAQLELSAAMKSKFLANISHELRTPVTLLTGMLELIRDKNNTHDAVGPERGNKDRIEVAYNNSRKLQYMVEEILDLSKLENNETRMNNKTKELAPLLSRMVYAFETLFQKENLNLEYNADNAHNLHVLIDEIKFEKIINNLIYNAIKFNNKNGKVEIYAGTTKDGRSVIIYITNTGQGISSKDLPHVFERFYQGDTALARAEGAGIGLSLVKEFTLLMGGTVSVASSEGKTTFTLQFPVAEAPNGNEAIEDIVPPLVEIWDQFPNRQTVLLVEDNTEMRYYLREILGEKVNLVEAVNGKEALKWLEYNTPTLIISDIMMPEMDGREFIEKLKSSDKYKKLPVIALTALADKDNQLSMLQMGIDDYIVKPFNASELRTRVYNLLNNYAERISFSMQPAEPDDVSANSPEASLFREKITAFVLKNIKNHSISVFDLAFELSMSERQLYRLAKNLTGCSPAQLIKEVRLQKAFELLQNGNIYKLDDIATRVGFETTAYFSRQFYARFGKRPTDFL